MKKHVLSGVLFVGFTVMQISFESKGCVTNLKSVQTKISWQHYFQEHSKVNRHSRKPADTGRLPYSKLEPWGGAALNWKPEAIMANAVSEALNDGFSEDTVKDVLISMPVDMQYSGNDLRVYGDGQTNAAVNLGNGWKETEPILIATLVIYKDDSQKLKIRLHQKLALKGKSAKLVYGGKIKRWDSGTQSSEGHTEYEWKVMAKELPLWGDLFSNRVAFFQPDGWEDWFPIDFRDVVRSAAELLTQIPPARRTLGKGTLLDPENVGVQGKIGNGIPFDGMMSESFGADLKAERYFPVPATGQPQGIHNVFYNSRVTAVGHGFSTVLQAYPKSLAPFKMAYICFDRRNQKEESIFGVPSGGGWHEIGDEAETVLNTLDKSPVVFGYANGKPANRTPSGNFAYGLKDIAVIRKLMPGSAIITSAGKTTYAEDTVGGVCGNAPNRGQGGPENRNYHWFIFDQSREVCAVEWVHPNIPAPSNKLGFAPLTRTGCK